MSMRKQIALAAALHISGTRSEGFAPHPVDAFETWNVSDLPRIEGMDSEQVRQALAEEIERQLWVEAR